MRETTSTLLVQQTFILEELDRHALKSVVEPMMLYTVDTPREVDYDDHEAMEVLETLCTHVDALGIPCRVLWLDRGFDRVKVIRALMHRQQPFSMPAIKRDTPPSRPAGQVTFDVAVVCHNLQGRWGRPQRAAWLYATWSVKHRPLRWMRQTSRRRFGIESSYRQVPQAWIKTCRRNPVVRFMLN